MESHPAIPYIMDVIVILLTSVVIVPLCHRLKVSPILGFLLIGIAIGPHGIGVVDNVDEVHTLAKFGVVFLLFTIGLEVSFERLWSMRRFVFGLGSFQVLATGCVIGGIAWAVGTTPEAAVIIGAGLALSSTALVLQLLIEAGEMASRLGRVTFSVLLFQDLAVVPILFVVTVFGTASDQPIIVELGLALAQALIAIAVIYFLGRLLLRPLFRFVAGARNAEIFVAMTLLTVVGAAAGMNRLGLSMALGAFLAGLLLSDTEFRHQVSSDIRPFKGLLLGLFFISVGMAIDLALVGGELGWIVISVIALIVVKASIAFLACRLFGTPSAIALRAAVLLAQGGEFAFVVVGAAMALGLMSGSAAQFILIITSISMLATPFLAILGRMAGRRVAAVAAEKGFGPHAEAFRDLEGHVIIAGFGRVGQTVAKLLESQDLPYVALDTNADLVSDWRKRGAPVYFGDASGREVLQTVGAEKCSAIVITLDDQRPATQVIEQIRDSWPNLTLCARARNRAHGKQLADLGAQVVVPETLESGLQLAGQVVHAMGTPMVVVNRLIERIRRKEYAGLPHETVDSGDSQ